jgi:hypothetical protein
VLPTSCDRGVQLLNCDIVIEEERARMSDRSDAAYPTLKSGHSLGKILAKPRLSYKGPRLTCAKAEH